MLYCLSLYAQLITSYMLCTYWLSGKAGQDNIWLEVMAYEPRSVTAYHSLVASGLFQLSSIKLKGPPNWIPHQIEWLTELNGLLSNWMTHYLMAQKTESLRGYWMIHSYSLGAHRALNAEPNARSLVCTRRQPIVDEIFLKFGSVTVFGVFPCYVIPVLKAVVFSVSPLDLAREWGKSHGTLFWLGRGPKIDSCSRQKIFIQS